MHVDGGVSFFGNGIRFPFGIEMRHVSGRDTFPSLERELCFGYPWISLELINSLVILFQKFATFGGSKKGNRGRPNVLQPMRAGELFGICHHSRG